VTAGIEAGPPLYMGDLAAKIGNTVRGPRIRRRGEQADDAVLTGQIARGVEVFDADIIEIDAPVHARVDIGLGDDQQPRLLEKRHDFRRVFEQFFAALEHAQFGRPHDAERVVEIGFQRIAVEGVIAHAEEREIVGQ
jgi:hypothetical protein